MKNNMIDTVIVSGGNIQSGFALDFLKNLQENKRKNPLRFIAADKGLEFFMETGIVPDVAVGDFDSLSPAGKKYLEQPGATEVLRLKPEKDDSDTQSALNLAIGKGSKSILILGATGTRIDHLLANLGLLALAREKGAQAAIADANNYITLAESGMKLERENQFGAYVSFFPMGGDVEGLTLEGFKYSLKNHHLTAADSGLTVSNEITEEEARVTFVKGSLVMIQTRD